MCRTFVQQIHFTILRCVLCLSAVVSHAFVYNMNIVSQTSVNYYRLLAVQLTVLFIFLSPLLCSNFHIKNFAANNHYSNSSNCCFGSAQTISPMRLHNLSFFLWLIYWKYSATEFSPGFHKFAVAQQRMGGWSTQSWLIYPNDDSVWQNNFPRLTVALQSYSKYSITSIVFGCA